MTDPVRGEGEPGPSPDDPTDVGSDLAAARDAFPLEPDEVALYLWRRWQG